MTLLAILHDVLRTAWRLCVLTTVTVGAGGILVGAILVGMGKRRRTIAWIWQPACSGSAGRHAASKCACASS